MENLTHPAAPASARYPFIDRLRVGATLLLIPYHCARMFDYVPWYVKNRGSNAVLDLFCRFVEIWHMPIFFLVSGAATACYFQSGRMDRFLKDRARKLLIPLGFGVLFLVPPITYVRFRELHPEWAGGVYEYLPNYFHVGPTTIDGMTGAFSPMHLWYILYLFIFSAVAFPFFKRMIGAEGEPNRRTPRIFASRNFGLLFFPPALIAARLTGLPYPNPVYFLVLFIMGFWLLRTKGAAEGWRRSAGPALIPALLISGWLAWERMPEMKPGEFPVFGGAGRETLTAVAATLWMVALAGFSQIRADRSSALLDYLQKACYPLYIMHMTAIVPIGFQLKNYSLNWPAGFALLNLTSFLACLVVYELAVKRFRVLAFLFGVAGQAGNKG